MKKNNKNAKHEPVSSIKEFLQQDGNWYRFYEKYKHQLRPAIIENILKIFSCGHSIRGYDIYCCSNRKCQHYKVVPYSCNGRFCSKCGYKQTRRWIDKQMQILPHCSWQHMVFTLPQQFRTLFWLNRELFNELSGIAAQIILDIAKEKGLRVGIFTALHSYGRDMKKHVHIHLSTTLGGLTQDGQTWKTLSFFHEEIWKRWRYEIIDWLRYHSDQPDFQLPKAWQSTEINPYAFDHLLDQYATKYWNVFLQKPDKSPKHAIDYLGRYIKRPPIAKSQLLHYDGHDILLRYRDHQTKTITTKKFSVEAFIGRFVQHIPDKYFRLIRYYGFLANSVRGTLLPRVRRLLHQQEPEALHDISWVELSLTEFGVDPLLCIICGAPMRLTEMHFGASNAELWQYHRQLALREKIVC